MNKDQLQKEIHHQLCDDIKLIAHPNGKIMVSNPFSFPDGDHYSIYLKEIEADKVRISDGGDTLMRSGFYIPDVNGDLPDVDGYFKGDKGKLMHQILAENQINEDNGNFYVDVLVEQLSQGIFRLCQALSHIYTITLLA